MLLGHKKMEQQSNGWLIIFKIMVNNMKNLINEYNKMSNSLIIYWIPLIKILIFFISLTKLLIIG